MIDKKTKEYRQAYFLTNRSGTTVCHKSEELNPFFWKVDEFTRRLVKMRTDSKEELLAAHLTHLVRGWSGLDTAEEADEDFANFQREAEASALEVEAVTELVSKCGDQSVKETTKEEKNKLTIEQKIEKSRLEEVHRVDSLESEFQSKYVVRKNLHIDQISLSEAIEAESPVDPAKVARLESDMIAWFDPTQMMFTVATEDNNYDPLKSTRDSQFVIIHGRHRLVALKNLSARKVLKIMPGMEKEEVLCWVMRSGEGVLEVGRLRGNTIQSNEVRAPGFLDILSMGQVMLSRLGADKAKVVETVQRWCKYKRTHPEDISTITHLLNMPEIGLKAARDVIGGFESFQTKDAIDVRRMQSKLRRGELRSMNKSLFRKFKKLSSDQMVVVGRSVMSKEQSIEEAVNIMIRRGIRLKSLQMMSQVMGVSVPGIRAIYLQKDKFKMEDLDKFEKVNADNATFIKFCENIQNDNLVDINQEMIVLEKLGDIQDIDVKDTIVIVASEEALADHLPVVIQRAIMRNSSCSILVVTKSETVAQEACTLLSSHRSNGSIRIYFEDDKQAVKDGVLDNAILGVISGTVYKAVTRVSGSFSRTIDSVVDSISPPNYSVTVVLISTKLAPFLLNHQNVQYVVGASSARQVEDLLRKRGAVEKKQPEELEVVAGGSGLGQPVDQGQVKSNLFTESGMVSRARKRAESSSEEESVVGEEGGDQNSENSGEDSEDGVRKTKDHAQRKKKSSSSSNINITSTLVLPSSK